MDELRKNIMDTIVKVIGEYEKVIEKTEEDFEVTFNLKGITTSNMTHIAKLDEQFSQFKQRVRGKKGWFS